MRSQLSWSLDLFILDVSCHPQCYKLDLFHKAPCYPLFTASCQLCSGNPPGIVNLVWIHGGGENYVLGNSQHQQLQHHHNYHYHPHKNSHLLSIFCEHCYTEVCTISNYLLLSQEGSRWVLTCFVNDRTESLMHLETCSELDNFPKAPKRTIQRV